MSLKFKQVTLFPFLISHAPIPFAYPLKKKNMMGWNLFSITSYILGKKQHKANIYKYFWFIYSCFFVH